MRHGHRFATGEEKRSGKKALLVTILTVVAMVVEIVVGMATNSMALLADGFHMATHAAALGVAAFAYWYAERHADDPRYTFGVGKVGALAGFTGALILAAVAVGVAWESVARLFVVQTIDFDEALIVAALGLAVNVASAAILGHTHDHHNDHHNDHSRGDHRHDHSRGDHHHGGRAHDVNMRSAYLHVLADALTSVCAIVALSAGKYLGWWILDPLLGLAGAVVVGVWARRLAIDASGVLLDRNDDGGIDDRIRSALDVSGDVEILDLHVWRVGPGHWAAIVSLYSDTTREVGDYRRLLAGLSEISHLTIEIHR